MIVRVLWDKYSLLLFPPTQLLVRSLNTKLKTTCMGRAVTMETTMKVKRTIVQCRTPPH